MKQMHLVVLGETYRVIDCLSEYVAAMAEDGTAGD